MEKEERQVWMDEILAIIQAYDSSLLKGKSLCKNGHSKTSKINESDKCTSCERDKNIIRKRKSVGSGSIWF